MSEEIGNLQQLAASCKQKRWGNRVSFVNNINISITNRCLYTCSFCGFSRPLDSNQGYSLDLEQILDLISAVLKSKPLLESQTGLQEVCLQSGINPHLDLKTASHLVKEIKKRFPLLHLHGFSPMEIFHLAGYNLNRVEYVLKSLQNEGLGSIPGTAAEILCDQLRQQICPQKLDSITWEKIILLAHKTGLPSSATILIGHLENWEQRMEHLQIIRRIQENSGGFTEFVVLPFIPWQTPLADRCQTMITREEILTFIAYCRLFFVATIASIQASWVKMGLDGALEAINWGANDLGGTLFREEIAAAAGCQNSQGMTEKKLIEAIAGAGWQPVRRDTQYTIFDPIAC